MVESIVRNYTKPVASQPAPQKITEVESANTHALKPDANGLKPTQ